MKRTATVSIRVDVRDLAALLKGAIDHGLLNESAPAGSDAHICAANLMRISVATTLSSLPEQREAFEASVAAAWSYLREHGLVGAQTPFQEDEQLRPAFKLAQLSPLSMLSQTPTAPVFDDVLSAMSDPATS